MSAATAVLPLPEPNRRFIVPNDAIRFVPEQFDVPEWLAGFSLYVGTITPALASVMLTRNVKNRGKKRKKIEDYAGMQKQGRWGFTSETIKFDRNGNLIDGQNRLFACVESDTPFTTLIAYGLDPKVFPHLDRGARRSTADNLVAEGEKNAHALAAAATLLWRLERGAPLWATETPEPDEVQIILDRHPGLRESMDAVKGGSIRLIRSHGAAGFFHYQFAQTNRDTADWFFARIGDGEMLRNTDAVKVLRDKLERDLNSNRRMGKRELYAVIIKAWNYTINARPASTSAIRFRGNGPAAEPFPEIR
jgi:hypothetical protein